VYQTGSPSHESVPRSSSQFKKGWWSRAWMVGGLETPSLERGKHHIITTQWRS